MKENMSMATAVLAIIISIIAVASGVLLKPEMTLGADAVGENELADNSVTSDKVDDGTLTDADITDTGISKIADNSIALQHLSTEVIAAMTGVVDIADNSVTGAKIAHGTITNVHINDSADIAPSKINGTAWTATNDGSGSGLDADKLDGIEGNQFLRNDMSGTISGDLTIEGTITHRVQSRYYTIPFCGFVGKKENTPYWYSGVRLLNSDPTYAQQDYYAHICLPHRANITKITVKYYMLDALASAGVSLEKVGDGDSSVQVVYIDLPQNSAFTNYETTVSETVLSNNQAYWVEVYLDPNDHMEDIQLSWISIEYTVTNSLP